MKNATLFVDGANWSCGLRQAQRVDFKRAVRALEERTQCKIVSKFYYTAFHDQESLHRRMKFLEYLKGMSWQVQAMPSTLGVDGRWRDKEVDIAIALDAYYEVCSGRADALILGSGDEDFGALLRRLPEGTSSWVVGLAGCVSTNLEVPVILLNDLGVIETRKEEATS